MARPTLELVQFSLARPRARFDFSLARPGARCDTLPLPWVAERSAAT